MTHADRLVVPDGGLRPFFGTNPFSFAVPAPGEDPVLLDMATSSIPFNRVSLRRATGTPLPADVAVDSAGEMTRDPHAAAALLPLGGAAFGYKGAGLAAMIDILCAAFTGMVHGAAMEPLGGPDYGRPIPLGHFFIVMNPAVFEGAATLDDRIGALLTDLRGEPASPGAKVMAPGDVEKAEAERRRRDGIPVDTETWRALATAALAHGVSLPKASDSGRARRLTAPQNLIENP
jgi:LDH2 family malate/lactate/ureidoglycolate dehydrogenase